MLLPKYEIKVTWRFWYNKSYPSTIALMIKSLIKCKDQRLPMIHRKGTQHIPLLISLVHTLSLIILGIINNNILPIILGMRDIQTRQSIANSQIARNRFNLIICLIKTISIIYSGQGSWFYLVWLVVGYGNLEVVVVLCSYDDLVLLLVLCDVEAREGYSLESGVWWHGKLVEA